VLLLLLLLRSCHQEPTVLALTSLSLCRTVVFDGFSSIDHLRHEVSSSLPVACSCRTDAIRKSRQDSQIKAQSERVTKGKGRQREKGDKIGHVSHQIVHWVRIGNIDKAARHLDINALAQNTRENQAKSTIIPPYFDP
jgi:hypothetical protein